jgi:hypothetical protein
MKGGSGKPMRDCDRREAEEGELIPTRLHS